MSDKVTEGQRNMLKGIADYFHAPVDDLIKDALGIEVTEENLTNGQACKVITHGNDLIGSNKELGE